MTAKAKRRVFWIGLVGTVAVISVAVIIHALPSEEERFIRAVQNGDAATVSAILNRRSELALLEQPHKAGATPVLQMALSCGNSEVVRLLLVHGATPDKYPGTLFYVYVRDPETAGLLLDRGVDINQKGKSGDAALHAFSAIRDASRAKFLIDHGADVNIKGSGGQTPLHRAAAEGNLDTAKLLVAKGADVNARSTQNKTPLDCATFAVRDQEAYRIPQDRIKRNREVGVYLLSCGSPSTVFDVAWLGDVVRLSKQLEADPSLANAQANGEPLLFAAVRGGSSDAVEYLLSHGVSLDVQGRFRQTPLQVAAYTGHAAVAKVLLDHGVAVDARGPWGETALHWAAFRGSADVATLLLSRGADPNISATAHTVDLNRMADDRNPIEREIKWFGVLEDQRRHKSQIMLLSRLAFTVGDTPLHVAAYWGHPDVVKLVIAGGADVKMTDRWGATALHLASASAYAEAGRRGSASDYMDIVRQLLAAGADPLARTRAGSTAAELAGQIGNRELVQLLTSRKRP